MAARNLRERVERLEMQIATIQATICAAVSPLKKNWRRAVDKYSGDKDLLAVFAEAKKLRDADRKHARRRVARRSKA
jgi:hypothetical protein